MFAIKIGEQNNREIVAYGSDRKFSTKAIMQIKVNYMDNIIKRYNEVVVIDSTITQRRLMNEGFLA